MEELRMRLILEIHDHGRMLFEAEVTAENQDELSVVVAYSVAQAMKNMNCPPDLLDVVHAYEDGSILRGLHHLDEEYWSAENDFFSAVSIEIDLDLLLGTDCPAEKREKAARWCKLCGYKIKGVE